MRIDGVLCASRTDTAVADWQQLTGQPIVLTGESHVVSLQMLQVSTPSENLIPAITNLSPRLPLPLS
jgi:hypothetical protein